MLSPDEVLHSGNEDTILWMDDDGPPDDFALELTENSCAVEFPNGYPLAEDMVYTPTCDDGEDLVSDLVPNGSSWEHKEHWPFMQDA